MKKLVLFIFFALICSVAYSQWIKTAVNQNGTWYPWRQGHGVTLSGSWDYFAVHSIYYDSSRFYFKIKIDNFTIPPKKVRKDHLKSNTWYEYSGYIEYWIDDDHLDFISALEDEALKLLPGAAVPWLQFGGRPSIVKKSPAKIMIQPYKSYPQLFNIWFEGIGYAFYFFDKGY